MTLVGFFPESPGKAPKKHVCSIHGLRSGVPTSKVVSPSARALVPRYLPVGRLAFREGVSAMGRQNEGCTGLRLVVPLVARCPDCLRVHPNLHIGSCWSIWTLAHVPLDLRCYRCQVLVGEEMPARNALQVKLYRFNGCLPNPSLVRSGWGDECPLDAFCR